MMIFDAHLHLPCYDELNTFEVYKNFRNKLKNVLTRLYFVIPPETNLYFIYISAKQWNIRNMS